MRNLSRLFFFLLFCGLIPLSCEKECDHCGCGPFENADFQITELDIKTINPASLNPLDSSVYYDVDSLVKSIFIADKIDVALKTSPQFNLFTNSAFACTPPEPKSTQFISSIQIISNRDMGMVYPDSIKTEDQITDLFLYKMRYGHDPDVELRWYNDLSSLPLEKLRFNENYNINLKLSVPPSQPTVFDVDIIITLSDSLTFNFENHILKVK